jgi:hypothetical protein
MSADGTFRTFHLHRRMSAIEGQSGHCADLSVCPLMTQSGHPGHVGGRWSNCPALMRWKKECPLRAQLPISSGVIGRDDIVLGGKLSVDRLVTDLEDAA